MDSSVSPKDEIWFLRVCHHISTGLYCILADNVRVGLANVKVKVKVKVHPRTGNEAPEGE